MRSLLRQSASFLLSIAMAMSVMMVFGNVTSDVQQKEGTFLLSSDFQESTIILHAYADDPRPGDAKKDGQTPPPASGVGGLLQSLGGGVGGVVSMLATLFLKLLSGILWFVLFWMGDLMDNTFILEGDIGEKIRSVWVIVRNFVNIFFALALVIVAFLSVVGYGDESGNYSMKKFIPKMAMALIAVNFTFLACKIVLDVNNVLTTAVFAIPQNVTNLGDIAATSGGQKTFKKFKCLDPNSSFDELMKQSEQLSIEFPDVINQLGGVCFADVPADATKRAELRKEGGKVDGQEITTLSSSTFTKKDFVWAMATQFQGLHNLNKASQLLDPTFTNLTVNALFSIVFAVIYGTAYVAMFIVLLGRMVVLWITIMLSPLAAISIAIPDLLPDKLNIQQQFLDHAFVPLKMAIPISFGYILISQMSATLQTDFNIVGDGVLDLTGGGEFARDISITSLMYGIASVAIMWMGVFMGISENIVGGGVVNSIKGFVEGAGSTVAKWPTYLPIIPTTAGKVSLSSVGTTFQQAQSRIAEMHREKEDITAQNLLAPFGLARGEMAKAAQDMQRMIKGEMQYDRTKAAAAMRTLSTNESEFKRVMDMAATSPSAEFRKDGDKFAKDIFKKSSFDEMIQHSRDPVKLREMRESAEKQTSTGATVEQPDYSKADNELKGQGLTLKMKVKDSKQNDVEVFQEEELKKLKLDRKGADVKTATVEQLGVSGILDYVKSAKGTLQKDQIFSNDNAPFWDSALKSDQFKKEAQKDTAFQQLLTSQVSSTDEQKNRLLFKIYTNIYARKEDGSPDEESAKRLEHFKGKPGITS